MVAIAPQDANRLGDILNFVQVIEHLGTVARNAGSVAEAFRPEDGIRPSVAEAHRHGAPVELWQLAELRQSIGHVGLALLDLLEPPLRTLLGSAIVMGERARNGAPEQVRRRSDKAVGRELTGNRHPVRT